MAPGSNLYFVEPNHVLYGSYDIFYIFFGHIGK